MAEPDPTRTMGHEFLRALIDSAAPRSERRDAAQLLAVEMRRLIDLLARSDAPAAALREATDDIAALVARLDAHPSAPRWYGFHALEGADEAVRDRLRFAHFDHSPLIGAANPVAPPLHMWVEGDRIVGECLFGDAYEGPPGSVHGGFVAAAFDELLGKAQALSGTPGMTANLVVNYRRPTPLRTRIRYEGWLVQVDGRKLFTGARSFADGVVTAEAEALFIAADSSRFADMARQRAARDGGEGGGAEGAAFP